MEPYAMNSTEFISRYKENPRAIYQEYAHAVAEGIVSYYATAQ